MTKKYIKTKSLKEIKKTLGIYNNTEDGAYFNPKMSKFCGKKLLTLNDFPLLDFYKEKAGGWSWHKDWFEYCDEGGNILSEVFSIEDIRSVIELNEMLNHFLNLRGI